VRGGRHSFWAEWQYAAARTPASLKTPAIRDNSHLLKAEHCNVDISLLSECKFNGGQVWNDPPLESFGENALNSFAAPIGVFEG
jgi:hypothetical protein